MEFTDIKTYPWAEKAIEVLASKGIIKGTSTEKKEFSPALSITRADYIALLVRTLDLTANVDSNFADVKKTDYYYNEVGIAKKLAITNGLDGKSFAPGAHITRQDMMVMTARALKALNI